MKILLDPVTTNDPHFCVMNYKMATIVKHLSAWRPDIYFYWLIPEKVSADQGNWNVDMDWFPHPERIKFIEVPMHKDRMREYLTLTDRLRDLFSFKGPCWDFDLVITARTTQVPTMRMLMHKAQSLTTALRRVITVEDMPVLSYKKCVYLTSLFPMADRLTISGYLAAHRNCFISFWEKDATAKLMARDYSPASRRDFLALSHDTSPIQVTKLMTKPAKLVTEIATGKKPLTVGYTQRWEVIHRRSAAIVEIMRKQFVYHGAKRGMRFIITSNSKSVRAVAEDWLEIVRAPREEFWRMMREDVDVILIMTIDDDYSMSLIEPLTLGTPAIIMDAQYVKPTLGDDYPFIVHNDLEAYAMLKMFQEDYTAQYAKFKKWQTTTFKTLMTARNEQWLPYHIQAEIAKHDELMAEFGSNKPDNPQTTAILPHIVDGDPLENAFHRAHACGDLRQDSVKDKNAPDRIGFDYNEWYRIKADLVARHGYTDCGSEPGTLEKLA